MLTRSSRAKSAASTCLMPVVLRVQEVAVVEQHPTLDLQKLTVARACQETKRQAAKPLHPSFRQRLQQLRGVPRSAQFHRPFLRSLTLLHLFEADPRPSLEEREAPRLPRRARPRCTGARASTTLTAANESQAYTLPQPTTKTERCREIRRFINMMYGDAARTRVPLRQTSL